MRSTSFHLLCLCSLVALAACDKHKPEAKSAPAPASSDTVARKAASKASKPAPTKAEPATTEPGPKPPAKDLTAPASYAVELKTSAGSVIIDVKRKLAPLGADRFYTLVKMGFFTEIALFRVIDGFVAQFGIHGHPDTATAWRDARIQDDAVKGSNVAGTLTFATAGPNTRTTQLFINLKDNTSLDTMGFAPFGKVRDLASVQKIYKGYGEGAPRGRGPDQGRIQREGNAYLKASFPKLDYVLEAKILEGA